MDRITRHLSYANIMATLAVLLAMSGGAIAATGGFSSGETLRACVNDDGALRLLKAGKHCHKGLKTVSWNQVGPSGAAGQAGSPGPAGVNGTNGVNANETVVVRTASVSVPATKFGTEVATCEPGEHAISGGSAALSLAGAIVVSAPTGAEGQFAVDGETPTGWGAAFDNGDGKEATTLNVYAVCAK